MTIEKVESRRGKQLLPPVQVEVGTRIELEYGSIEVRGPDLIKHEFPVLVAPQEEMYGSFGLFTGYRYVADEWRMSLEWLRGEKINEAHLQASRSWKDFFTGHKVIYKFVP